MTFYIRILLLLCAGFPALIAPVCAAEDSAPLITVRAGTHPDFDRLVLDWPKRVAYTVKHDGPHVKVEFAASAQTKWQQVVLAHMTRANGFVSSTDAEGNLTVSFTVNPKATIKDFTSGNSVAIDIVGPAVGETAHESPTPTATPKTDMPSPEKASAQPVEKQVKTEPPPPAPAPVASVAPVTPPPAAPPASAPQGTNPVVPFPAPVPAAESQPLSASDTRPAPLPTLSGPKNVSFPDIGTTPLLVASFDPHVELRVAVYERGGYGYIIFERKLTLDLNALTAGQPAPRLPIEVIDLPKASGYRFPMPPAAELRATRNNTVWQIFVARQQPDVPVSATLVAQPDFALGARLLLPLPDAPEPVHMTDPVVGDDLILVPLSQTQAFSVLRKMADIEILPAAQGLVIKPLTDKLIVRDVTDGVEITAEGGLRLSSSNDTGASQESSQRARAAEAGKSMFDFATWRGKGDETFSQTRQRLQQTIVDVPESERNRARLELARFYFAHGNGEEAAALLAYLVKLVPDLGAHADFRALDGAAKILAWRPDEGLKDLDTSTLGTQPEIELWQAVGEAELRDWKSSEEKFAITEPMLYGYPEPFYSRFSVLAVEAALAVGKDREAADWLDRLENGHHLDSIEPAIDYLHGVLDAKSGHPQKAEASWKDVATSNDHLYRVRAKLALVDLAVSTRSLTPAQAADQLENLRFAWRGDDLELDILHRLGEFYIQSKNIKAGLNTLAKAVQLYPNSPMTPAIREEMAGIFHDVFLTDLGTQLSPLDALTLYQQYRSLMPAGADGIAVMRNLAERLVQIDLLDQAAGLLEDLVKNSLQGEEKSKVSARLAAIRLLDYKPQQALDGLDLAKDISVPAELQNERTLLRSKALSELKSYDGALDLIKNNNSQPAKLLRADINMRAQRWTDASRALLDLIGPPPPAGGSLTPEQAQWLVSCAIAASLAGDIAGLDKLKADYGAGIATLPQNDTFRMLTEPETAEQTRDIAAAQSKIADVDMFQGFLNSYRQAATDSPEAEKAGGAPQAQTAPPP